MDRQIKLGSKGVLWVCCHCSRPKPLNWALRLFVRHSRFNYAWPFALSDGCQDFDTEDIEIGGTLFWVWGTILLRWIVEKHPRAEQDCFKP